MIQNVGHALVIVGMAVCAQTGRFLSAISIGVERPVHVASDKEVELSVIVVIEKARACAPPSTGDACVFGDVCECTVSIVVIERIPVVVRDVNILKSVIVVISDGHTHPIVILRHPGEARFFRHVGEGTIGILVIKAIPEFAIGFVRRLMFGHGSSIFAPLTKKMSNRPSLS